MVETEKLRDYPIKKSNDMVQKTMFMLTAQEFDLLQYIIMKIKDDDMELKPMEISIREYCKVANISINGQNYDRIKESLKNLRDKSIWIPEYDDKGKLKSETLIAWIDAPVKIDYGTGMVKLQLSEVWRPYLTQLKEKYTVTTLREMLPMKSIYGKRLYELLNSYVMGDRTSYYVEFTVEELKRILLGDKWDKIYKEFKNFNAYVLKPALRDMEKYGNLDVKMTLKRLGRSYKYIYFDIRYKDPLKRNQAYKNSEEFFDPNKTKE